MHPIGVIRRGEQSFVRDRLGSLGLMPVDAFCLRMINKLGECNQDALCTRMEIDKGRVAKLLAGLEARGLIQRTINEKNKREKRVVLTDQGRETLALVNQTMDEWNEIGLSGFTEEERAQYFSYLSRIADNVNRFRKEGWPRG